MPVRCASSLAAAETAKWMTASGDEPMGRLTTISLIMAAVSLRRSVDQSRHIARQSVLDPHQNAGRRCKSFLNAVARKERLAHENGTERSANGHDDHGGRTSRPLTASPRGAREGHRPRRIYPHHAAAGHAVWEDLSQH